MQLASTYDRSLKTVALNDLSQGIRQLLTDAEQAGGLVVEDENGRARSRIYAYPEPTQAERQAAWDRLRSFQENVQQSFDSQGVERSRSGPPDPRRKQHSLLFIRQPPRIETWTQSGYPR
jgi:hypothetical protein